MKSCFLQQRHKSIYQYISFTSMWVQDRGACTRLSHGGQHGKMRQKGKTHCHTRNQRIQGVVTFFFLTIVFCANLPGRTIQKSQKSYLNPSTNDITTFLLAHIAKAPSPPNAITVGTTGHRTTGGQTTSKPQHLLYLIIFSLTKGIHVKHLVQGQVHSKNSFQIKVSMKKYIFLTIGKTNAHTSRNDFVSDRMANIPKEEMHRKNCFLNLTNQPYLN